MDTSGATPVTSVNRGTHHSGKNSCRRPAIMVDVDQVSEHATYPQNYFLMGMLLILLLGIIAVFRKHEANPVLEPIEADSQ